MFCEKVRKFDYIITIHVIFCLLNSVFINEIRYNLSNSCFKFDTLIILPNPS
jgi:hypothetical protein